MSKHEKKYFVRKTILSLAAYACLGVTVLSACTPIKATRGNLLAPEQIQEIQKGQQHKSDVIRILGTPTSTAIFDENKWYYVGMHTEQMAFFDPEVTEKTILAVTFDENDMVMAINNIDGEGYDVPLSSRTTPTSGQDLNALQQILGNVGRFNAPGSLD